MGEPLLILNNFFGTNKKRLQDSCALSCFLCLCVWKTVFLFLDFVSRQTYEHLQLPVCTCVRFPIDQEGDERGCKSAESHQKRTPGQKIEVFALPIIWPTNNQLQLCMLETFKFKVTDEDIAAAAKAKSKKYMFTKWQIHVHKKTNTVSQNDKWEIGTFE